MPRSPLLHGLRLTLRHPRPLLWTYAFNVILVWSLSLGLRAQLSSVMANSLGAQRLISAFDLGVAVDAARRLSDGPPGVLTPSLLATPIYVLLFFLLVPGTLLTYQTDLPIHMGGLSKAGFQSFWSFVRITLLTVLVSGLVLGLLGAAQGAWVTYVDRIATGRQGFVLSQLATAVVLLAACLLRLYFDLVEIHTVALAETMRPTGRPDRRVRKTLRPALKTLRRHLVSSYLGFFFLVLCGFGAVYIFSFSALRHLAQPRAWPTLLLAQCGIFLLLFTRFWQRAAETVLFQNVNPSQLRSNIFARMPANPPPPVPLEPRMSSFPSPDPLTTPVDPILPGPSIDPGLDPNPSPFPDPLPGPEPVAPSLSGPDAGVFHHEAHHRSGESASTDDLIK